MSNTLDERMTELLGPPAADEITDVDGCPVVLEMGEDTAALLVEGLRCSLYGGQMKPPARGAMLVTLDAITSALVDHECADSAQGCARTNPQGYAPINPQACGRTI